MFTIFGKNFDVAFVNSLDLPLGALGFHQPQHFIRSGCMQMLGLEGDCGERRSVWVNRGRGPQLVLRSAGL